ncbi:hypothetical protein EMIT0324P_70238 [Pseudomonas chlororaphis]
MTHSTGNYYIRIYSIFMALFN